jgi:RHS repeat-associated protein
MGRVLTDKQQTPSGAISQFPYTYNYSGNVLTQSNGVSNYTNTYNAIGQLTNINASYLSPAQSGTLATGFTYNAFGMVTYDTLGNSLNETFGYDQTGSPTSYLLSSGTYQYGTNSSYPNAWVGNYLLSSGDNVNGDWTYGYDSFGRLSAANCAGNAYCPAANGGAVNYTYAYDRYGNRWQQNVTSGTGINTLLTFNTNNQVTSNTYDVLGNVINDGTYTYSYDAENRPMTVSGGTSYAYDAFGRRVYRQVTAGTREYTYDLQGNVLTRLISGSIAPAYISIAGRQWGEIPTSSGSTWFMHTDWLGNARAYTKLYGTLQATCQTLPFGDARSCTVSSDDDYYAGSLWWNGDDSSYLSETRRYNPAQAHWTTTDPSGLASVDVTNPHTWNRYAYVMNNPLGYVDPTGLACWPLEKQMFGSCAGFMGNGVNFGSNWNEFGILATLLGPGQTGDVAATVNGVPVSETMTYYGGDLSILNLIGGSDSWGWNFTKSLFGNFSLSTKPGTCLGVFVDTAGAPLKKMQDAAQKYLPAIASAMQGAPAGASFYVQRVNNMVQSGASEADPAVVAAMTTAGAAAATAAPYVSAAVPYALPAGTVGVTSVGLGKELWAGFHGQCSW